MTQREHPEERLVSELETTWRELGVLQDRRNEERNRLHFVSLPIARAMAEVVRAARETDRAFDATAFPALRAALQALDSLEEG